MTIRKWGGLASFTQAAIFLIVPVIYLVALPAATGLPLTDFGDPFKLRPVLANPVFDLGDFLFGPVWAASLVIAFYALREHIGDRAKHRMNLALLAAGLSAVAFTAGATVQTIYRHGVAINPQLDATVYEAIFRSLSFVVPGMTSAGRHFLGWSLIMLGSAGLASKSLPRGLSILYLVGGDSIADRLPDSRPGRIDPRPRSGLEHLAGDHPVARRALREGINEPLRPDRPCREDAAWLHRYPPRRRRDRRRSDHHR